MNNKRIQRIRLALVASVCVLASGAYASDLGSMMDLAPSELSGTNSSTATISQSGQVNKALITQGSGANQHARILQTSASVNSEAQILQNGSDNMAAVVQLFGADNSARITQNGDGNLAATGQMGFQNQININQNNGGNTAAAAQIGGHNQIDITQLGNQTIAVTQIGFGGSFTVVQP
ncbi:hypothetical protein [Pusillimonas sp. ANT_WB101]|uniref:hypothetical protein n=1 Tax=Pusillimonas sp. ANT_WB101 TaxID=2597356 RepID=UPI0011ED9B5C|nr:hypothetical protein [Pusillimonas sp. ANT_WB101]KAA0911508.1 hypothetical protein FQ179_06700 [Pusillimonas sp. ANT_WB101]